MPKVSFAAASGSSASSSIRLADFGKGGRFSIDFMIFFNRFSEGMDSITSHIGVGSEQTRVTSSKWIWAFLNQKPASGKEKRAFDLFHSATPLPYPNQPDLDR